MSQQKRLFFVVLAACLFVGMGTRGEAQARRVIRSRPVVVGGYYYADPFFYGYPWFPYYSPFYGPFPYGPYPYYYAVDRGSSVRIDVKPKEAEVYVDGYYAGIVDDFDGVFQRLHVPPGQHEITLYHDGYRTLHQNVYLSPRSTFKIHSNMDRLAAGDVAEPRPTPPPQPPRGAGADSNQPNPAEPRRAPGGRRFPPPSAQGPGPRDTRVSSSGSLAIRVQPSNATILIDGERWEGPQGDERLIVQVSEGPHRIEVQKDGFDSFSADVTVRRGETTPLNVSLHSR